MSQILQLPDSAYVNKFVPKTKFFERAVINTKLKQIFTDKIQRITWLYKISEDTINTPKTEKIEEIQIFKIELKKKEIPKKALQVIDRSIPYPILYIFMHEESVAYAIKLHGNPKLAYYFSDWGEEIIFSFKGLTLETIYQGIVSTFINPKSTERVQDFQSAVETDQKQKQITKSIQSLESKIRKEKQFNKKVELNQELHQLQKALKNSQSASRKNQ